MNNDEISLAVFNAIKGHYFNDNCKHESHEKCCQFLVAQIAKIVGYEAYTPKVTDGLSKENQD